MINNELRMLTQFIINNYRLEKLRTHLNEFNPLKVLKVNHYEIRHSNVLGWILDPDENHNLRDLFFKKIVLETLNHDENSERENPLNITETSIFLNSFHDLEVKREYPIPGNSNNRNIKRYIDLVLVSHLNKMVVIIENKINAQEGLDQLEVYYNFIASEYTGYDILPIYLTKNGDQPSLNKYFVYSYIDLYRLIDDIIPSKKDLMSEKVYSFVNDYLCILKELTVTESEYKELCEDLYKDYSREINYIDNCNEKELNLEETEDKQLYDIVRKYKDVAQYIKEHGDVDYFKKAFYQFLEEHPNLTFYRDNHQITNAVFFYSKDYRQIQNYSGLTFEKWYSDYPCPLIFDREEHHISLKFEVGHFKEEFTEERTEFVQFLRENTNYNVTTAKKQGRIIKEKLAMDLKDWRDPQIILGKMNELYSLLTKDEEIIIRAIKDFWVNRSY